MVCGAGTSTRRKKGGDYEVRTYMKVETLLVILV